MALYKLVCPITPTDKRVHCRNYNLFRTKSLIGEGKSLLQSTPIDFVRRVVLIRTSLL